METIELLKILMQGEDSRHQFKKNINNIDSMAQELIAFSNTQGGLILVGVDDDGAVTGITANDLRRINQLLSNTASHNMEPAINLFTEIVMLEEKRVLLIYVAEGMNKPYQDKNGTIWIKNGSDKRKATSREELQRLFQESGLVHADNIPAVGMTIVDLDMPYFRNFFRKRYDRSLDDQTMPLEKIINNMNLGNNEELTITGALLFAQTPSIRLPVYIVKAIAFPGDTITTETYIDSRDITGKLSDIFQQTVGFILSNIKQIQGEQGVNSVGQPEIPRIVLEELVANALVHRNYFISAPIRVCIFSDRVEIISPGHLPNNLTIENIKAGISNIRNPILTSFATSYPIAGLVRAFCGH
ncbi:MAG: RNA-binding domain-containing protein [Salinispira sp.]